MSNKNSNPKNNTNAVELTQAELNSVAGGSVVKDIYNDAVDWFFKKYGHRHKQRG
jgi:hypothetical protein